MATVRDACFHLCNSVGFYLNQSYLERLLHQSTSAIFFHQSLLNLNFLHSFLRSIISTRLEEHDSFVTQIEKYKPLGFVCYKRSEVSANYTMPVRWPSLVEFCLYLFCTLEPWHWKCHVEAELQFSTITHLGSQNRNFLEFFVMFQWHHEACHLACHSSVSPVPGPLTNRCIEEKIKSPLPPTYLPILLILLPCFGNGLKYYVQRKIMPTTWSLSKRAVSHTQKKINQRVDEKMVNIMKLLHCLLSFWIIGHLIFLDKSKDINFDHISHQTTTEKSTD